MSFTNQLKKATLRTAFGYLEKNPEENGSSAPRVGEIIRMPFIYALICFFLISLSFLL